MGCGSSNANETADTDLKKDMDDLMGKKIPKFLIMQQQVSDSDNEDPKSLAADGNLDYQRQNKKPQKKFKGGEEEKLEILENVVKLERTIQKSDMALIEESCKQHFVFFNLSHQAMQYLMHRMLFCTQKRDEYIFKQGDQATCYFIVQRGSVEILVNDKRVNVVKEGGYFGEIALLYNAARSASIRTLSDCNFWMLERSTFKKAIEDMMMKEYDENRRFIDQVTFFSFMTAEQRDSIASALITTRFEAGQNIVSEGDQADSYFVIKSGEVSVWRGKTKVNVMGPKDSFGEQALYEKSFRGATVKAESEVRCLALARDHVTKILGDKVQIIIFGNIMRWSFGVSPVISQLTKLQQEKIRLKAKIQNCKKGQPLYSEGQVCDLLTIVLEGSLVSESKTIQKGQCFGDYYLPSKHRDDKLTENYSMGSPGVIAIISFAAIFKVLGSDFEQAVVKNEDSHEVKIKNIGERKDFSHIKVEDLIYIKKLGSGQFGWVYLVKHKELEDCFALKSVSKASIIEQSLERHILQERQVLEMCNFPFIMSFIRSFKDEQSIYFLVQYIRGMELFDVIREMGLLNKEQTSYYIGTLILALEYLHSKGVVYRDIKPENIMVNDQGIMMLVDLGTAKQVNKSKAQRTYTIIGTPHYMAPEIILGKGYSYNVDLWSVGVCMYEFLCGGVPYAEDNDDPYEIYEEIMNTQLRFPQYFKDRVAKKLIEQLLAKQPESRLGQSYAALKAHLWFDDLDWDALFSKSLNPPFIPPDDRVISQKDVQKAFLIGKQVVQEIKYEQQQQKIKYRKDLAKDPNWDKQF